MKKCFLLPAILLCGLYCAAQDTKDGVYFEKLRPIDKSIFSSDLKLFKTLFWHEYPENTKGNTEGKAEQMRYLNDLYFYAAALALEGRKDSAFYYIGKILRHKEFENFDGLLGDIAFDNIRTESRWKSVSDTAIKQLLNRTRQYKQPLLGVRLLAINMTDQSNILFNADTVARKKVAARLVDSITLLLERNGYPGIADVGKEAATVPALVLAHAGLPVQLRYSDVVYRAGMRGDIPGGMAGVLLDKIRVKQKGTQLYGSQYRVSNGQIIFYPIEDSTNLDARRHALGFGITYPEYKSLVENQFKR